MQFVHDDINLPSLKELTDDDFLGLEELVDDDLASHTFRLIAVRSLAEALVQLAQSLVRPPAEPPERPLAQPSVRPLAQLPVQPLAQLLIRLLAEALTRPLVRPLQQLLKQ